MFMQNKQIYNINFADEYLGHEDSSSVVNKSICAAHRVVTKPRRLGKNVNRNGSLTRCWLAGLAVVFLCLAGDAWAVENSVLEGTVRAEDGRPMTGVYVRLEILAAKKIRPVEARTDKNGKYRFFNLDAGTYRVIVSSASTNRESIEEVRVKGTRRLDFKIKFAVVAAPEKPKHLVWVPGPKGATSVGGRRLGGRWMEVDDEQITASGPVKIQKKVATGRKSKGETATATSTYKP